MPKQQPDILLIILDTLRRDRLSAYGYTQETSPAFDRFAEQSTLFTRAISPAQWTVPAHASIFTGLYPTSHQVTQANTLLSPHIPTLADILRGGGYRTVGFCNNPLVGVLENGLTRGFESFYNYAGAAPNRPQDVTKSAVRRRMARRWQAFAKSVSQRFAQNDALFRLSLHPLLTPIWTRSINYKGNTAHSIGDMIDVLTAHRAGGRDKPLFGFLNLMGGHMPYRPPQDVLHRFAPELRNDRAAYRFMARFNADAARWASPTDPPLSADERRIIDAFYTAEVAYQDAQLKRLLDTLRTSGGLDDTMVIIAADHGEGHGDHDFFGHSFVVYQELVHVPMAIRYPDRFPSGTRISTNVSTRRLFHTILDAAGVESSTDDIHALSLVNALDASRDHERGMAFAEAIPPTTFLSVLQHRNPESIHRLKLTQARRGVYADGYKLAVVENQVEGLFNVSDDPAELRDLSGDHAPLVTDLQAQIDAFVESAYRQRVDAAATVTGVSADMLDNLRALGYVD